MPWFWSDQYEFKLQMVGLQDGYDRAVTRPGPAGEGFITCYLRDGRVLAAAAVNRPGEFMMAKRLVAEATHVDLAALADPATPLKALLAKQPAAMPAR